MFYIGLIFIACFFICVVKGVRYTDSDGNSVTVIRSVKDTRWGIDVIGGVSVTFGADENAGNDTMNILSERIQKRLDAGNLADYELYVDNDSNNILLSFPWDQNEDGNAMDTIEYLSTPGVIRLIEGRPADFQGLATDGSVLYLYDSIGSRYPVLLDSERIAKASAGYDDFGNSTVTFSFDEEGTALLADGTGRQVGDYITVWFDNRLISTMAISSVNISGEITVGKWGGLAEADAAVIVRYCETGALPVQISARNYEITDRAFADNTMRILIVTGIIALAAMCIVLLLRYRLPGFIASVALIGHISGMLAATSGFVRYFDGITLTLPGIAGLIVSVGIGVDANIITAERIKDEILKGKSIHSSIEVGCRSSASSIFDGNITMIIVAVIIMGVFGPPKNICNIILRPFLWMFPAATTGTIYAFGEMLFFGVVFNILIGVFLSRMMLVSASRNRFMHNRWLFGGERRK